MGRNHGRISQAFYDGNCLNLQYTQLMSFEENASPPPPMELFLRYWLAKPIGIRKLEVVSEEE